MLLHLCHPKEFGSKEMGRVKPNGGVMYPGVDESFLYIYFFLSLSHKDTRALKIF